MDRYKYRRGRKRKTPGGENTNQHKARLIGQYLEAGESVRILALEPGPACKFVDLNVDLVKGLENPLIAKFGPEWNR